MLYQLKLTRFFGSGAKVGTVEVTYEKSLNNKSTLGISDLKFWNTKLDRWQKIHTPPERTTYTRGADIIDLSVGLGHKWVTKSRFTFEANISWGKLLFNPKKTDHDQVARFGAQIDYKF